MDISDPEIVWSELLRRISEIKEHGHPTGPELQSLTSSCGVYRLHTLEISKGTYLGLATIRLTRCAI